MSAYGKTLDLNRGRLIYSGGIISNPTVDLAASKKIQTLKNNANTKGLINPQSLGQGVINGTVGVRVQGNLSDPKTTLFSHPSMSANDQLAYLIADVPSSQLSAAQGQLITNTVLSMLHNNSTTSSVKKLSHFLNLDELNINTTTTLDPITGGAQAHTALVLGKAISPQLFISYSLGLLDPINVLKLQYKLNQHWLVQTSSSTDGNSAGDILYYWDKD